MALQAPKSFYTMKDNVGIHKNAVESNYRDGPTGHNKYIYEPMEKQS